jgi:hypothetical protein
MNANKFLGKCLVLISAMVWVAGSCFAYQNLDAHGQSKVGKAMAKKWSQTDTSQDGYQAQQNKSVVNIGSQKSGNCVVNVGTTQKGQKAPKDVVVTTKEVINVCK